MISAVIQKFLMSVLAFAVPYLTGYFVVSLIERTAELRFRILLALPMGFGISSILYFIYMCCNINNFSSFAIFECTLMVILAILYYNEEKPDLSKHKFLKLSNWFYIFNLYAVLIFLKYFLRNPMGSWDGFRIWNIKSEFLFVDNPLWQNVFDLPHFMSHNDYPMFLPSNTARIWEYFGGQNFFGNMIFGLIITFGLVYLLYQAIQYFKSEKIALVVASVFMISDTFLVNGASQCADIALAYFFLSTIVCLFFFFKRNKTSYLVLSMIFAGLSVWVKNEGMMFFLIYTLSLCTYFVAKKDYKKLITPVLTAIPVIVLLTLFKKITHSPNDLIAGFFDFKTWEYAFDFHRYAEILKVFVKMIFTKFSLFFVLILLTIKGFKIKEVNKKPFFVSCIILLLMVLGYFCVYLFSPHDIRWLTENSLDRIILQVLPIFLFLFAVNLRIGKPDTTN